MIKDAYDGSCDAQNVTGFVGNRICSLIFCVVVKQDFVSWQLRIKENRKRRRKRKEDESKTFALIESCGNLFSVRIFLSFFVVFPPV